MPDDLDPRDREVLAAAADWFDHAEPIPPGVLDAAYAAGGMARLDEELAALAFDSLVAGVAMRAAGSERQARLISFVADQVTIDIEVSEDGTSILGQIDPVPTGEVLLESDGGDVEVAVDEFGRFRVGVPAWPARLRVVGATVTPWVSG